MKNRWMLSSLLCFTLVYGCALPNEQQRTGEQQKLQQQRTGEQRRLQQQEAKQVKQAETPELAGGDEQRVREPHPVTLADLHRKYPRTFKLSGLPTQRQVALTFDDGPDAVYTPQVLDMLKKYNVKATFFLIGNRAQKHPEIVKRMVREGHEIGNHTYTHPNLPKILPEHFQWQIKEADNIISRQIGYHPRFFRPPYGAINEEQIKWLASQKYTVVNWNVDSLDWKGLSADKVADNILSNIHFGAIILQHSAGGKGEDLTGTIKALPKIITKLRADKVSFVTVSGLLKLPKNR